jgi:hypothetical protein
VYNWDSDQVCHDQNDKAHMEGQPATLSINNGDQVKIKHMRSKHFHLDVHKYGTQPSGCASNSPDNPFDNIPFDTHWYRRDFTSGNIDPKAVHCVYSFLIKVKNDTGGQCDPHVAIEQ